MAKFNNIIQADPAVQTVTANTQGTRGFAQINVQLKPIGERKESYA
jgi:hypothetical protein